MIQLFSLFPRQRVNSGDRRSRCIVACLHLFSWISSRSRVFPTIFCSRVWGGKSIVPTSRFLRGFGCIINMELTLETYNDEIYKIISRLRKASVVSIDFEFTGLFDNSKGNVQKYLDSPEERYAKCREAAKSFYSNQIGVSIFSWNNKNSCYDSYKISSHLIQRTSPNFNFKYKPFFSDPSSLEFLAKNNYDFNKWIYEGVPYLRKDHEKCILLNDFSSRIGDMNVDPELKSLMIMKSEKIVSWIVDSINETTIVDAYSKQCANALSNLIDRSYPGIRCEVNGQYLSLSNGIIDLSEESDCPIICVKRLVGFRMIVDSIMEFKIPLVLHNGFLDMLHMYEKFVAPLPDTLDEFKKSYTEKFGVVYDTKYLFDLTKIEITTRPSLEAVTEEMKNEKYLFPKIEDSESSDGDGTQFHDAGYDSYCTGVSFLKMMAYIKRCEKSTKLDISAKANQDAAFKIRLVMSDIEYINMMGDDAIASRDNVYAVYDTDKDVKGSTVNIEFSEEVYGPRYVDKMGDGLFYLRIVSKDKIPVVDKLCEKSQITPDENHLFHYKIAKYSEYMSAKLKNEANAKRHDYTCESKSSPEAPKDECLAHPPAKRKKVDTC